MCNCEDGGADKQANLVRASVGDDDGNIAPLKRNRQADHGSGIYQNGSEINQDNAFEQRYEDLIDKLV